LTNLHRSQVTKLMAARKEHQDHLLATSNILEDKRYQMLPVAEALRENPPPFRSVRFLSAPIFEEAV
jgi:hypothetical protein